MQNLKCRKKGFFTLNSCFSDIEDAEKAGSESRSATSEYENMVNLVKLDSSELDDYRIVQFQSFNFNV